MNKTLIILAFASITAACTTMKQHQAAGQPYRMAGDDKPIQITGSMETKHTEAVVYESIAGTVKIDFDGLTMISGTVPMRDQAELFGQDYKGRKTSAICTSKTSLERNVFETRCIVFIGNERTVTLTF